MRYDAVLGLWQPLALAAAIVCCVLLGAVLVVAAIRRADGSSAASAVLVLLVLLLGALAVLAPEQSAVALGLELAVLGLGLGIVTVVRLSMAPAGARRWWLAPPLLPATGLVVGGLLVETGNLAGLHWAFGGLALGILVAVERVWIMLVPARDI